MGSSPGPAKFPAGPDFQAPAGFVRLKCASVVHTKAEAKGISHRLAHQRSENISLLLLMLHLSAEIEIILLPHVCMRYLKSLKNTVLCCIGIKLRFWCIHSMHSMFIFMVSFCHWLLTIMAWPMSAIVLCRLCEVSKHCTIILKLQRSQQVSDILRRSESVGYHARTVTLATRKTTLSGWLSPYINCENKLAHTRLSPCINCENKLAHTLTHAY